MKLYGRICHDLNNLTTETVKVSKPGVSKVHEKYICNQCGNTDQTLFFNYYCHHCNATTTYCRYCINLGKVQSCKAIYIIESERQKSLCKYRLNFELSEQQRHASDKIKQAVLNSEHLLLHAVTGAGKTEMIFEGISVARQNGDNVAVVSPRVDVVKEVYLRLAEAFKDEQIDLMYEGNFGQYNSTFVVATVHQLMRYDSHFDVVIVDEVDAFPLDMDNQLMHTIHKASTLHASHIYLTATPNQQLQAKFTDSQIIKLPARYHGHSLPLPEFQFNAIKETKLNQKLLKLLKKQIEDKRKTFVFFHDISYMKKVFNMYEHYFSKIEYVSSVDSERHEKVSLLRNDEIDIMFTTTILERGVTLEYLDVVIVHTEKFTSSAIIQIAGRVGRKLSCPTGKVVCYHEGITKNMLHAKNEISKMNSLARKKGWIT
ncbi:MULTISPECIES: DEAD/DEAH box helicase family protein [Mammaliicoccus]|uniref:DEAD/DEAH box helicase family protein n=1 Tax=Mammaliicoccus TaxID=2803850 RepID=UPI000E681DCF|nr:MULTISPECIES: DEAD/DEAH box helicase family protein [Mammaliicoccus]MEB6202226.1 DEAD/DEAH box helicase family protein [Mammaliicoccus fleurettii]MEB7805061.1 DEAD/DEAH box helicase family protein [Mammaliicoccus fleurettii]RIL51371.1 DNA/RNA helicase [Mammaliicoccus fleurettii]